MNKDKLKSLFERQVAKLEQQVEHLTAANKALEREVSNYKTTILSKDRQISELREQLNLLIVSRENEIGEIKDLHSRLNNELSDVISIRAKAEKEIQELMKRIRTQR